MEGAPVLARLVAAAGDQIVVMPGGGVTERNIARILSETKVPRPLWVCDVPCAVCEGVVDGGWGGGALHVSVLKCPCVNVYV